MADSYDQDVQDAAREWQVNPHILHAIILQESSGNPAAVSKAGARGLGGIMPDTAKGLGITDPGNQRQHVFGIAKYFNEALTKEGNPEDALRYYHGGPNWRSMYGQESKSYVPAVTAHYQRLAGAASQGSPDVAAPKQADDIDAFLTGATPAKQAAPANSGQHDEIDAFLTGANGGNDAAKPQEPQTTWRGVAKNAAAGAIDAGQNVINFLSDPAGNLGKLPATAAVFAHDALASTLGYNKFDDKTRQFLLDDNVPQLGTRAVNAISGATGIDPNAVPANTDTERLTRKVVGAAGSAAALGGSNAVAPAVIGATVGDAAGNAAPEWAKPAAEMAGNIIGGAAAIPAGKFVAGTGNKLMGATSDLTPEIAQLAKTAREKYGIPVTAPQMSDNSLVRIANDQSTKLPFSGAGKNVKEQQGAWQKAVATEMGEPNAASFTPGVMKAAADRITGVMDDIAKRTTIEADQPFVSGVGAIKAEAERVLAPSEYTAVNKQVNDVLGKITQSGGKLDGDTYQAMVRTGSPLERLTHSADPNTAHYAGRLVNELENMFERSAAPQDKAALAQARYQYRVLKTVQPLAEKSADGNISPGALQQQVINQSRRFDSSTGGIAYTGGGNLGELAYIGKRFMGSQPDSGTPARMMVNGALGLGGIGAGVGAGVGVLNPFASAAVPVGLAANRLLGAHLRSDYVANRAINGALTPRAAPSLVQQAAAIPFTAAEAATARNRLMQQ